MAIWVRPGFRRVSNWFQTVSKGFINVFLKGFQRVPNEFAKGFTLLKPGFLRVSKRFLMFFESVYNGLQWVTKELPKGFFIVFKAVQIGFLSYESFEIP